MKTKITLFLMSLLLSLGVQAAKVEKTVKLTINGKSRSFLLYVPSTVKADTATPLVFSLHGTGGHSSDKSPFRTSVADSKGCIVVYPQGSDIYFPVFGGTLPGWNSIGETSEDIDFFKAIIEEVAKTYTVDRERIYCCGFSNGGMMTYTVANVARDTFAAFCSISGFPLNEFHLHHTSGPVPFLHIHGKADDFVKYSLMPSIVDNMLARNGAVPVAEKTSVKGKYDKSVYAATEGGFPYIYYEVDGMGHNDYTDRTEDGNSALTMWNFMSQYTLSTPYDTTLRFRPNLETEGFKPASHGWAISKTATTALLYGREQKTDANQNVYRSLQFENGKYKLCFKSEGEAGKTLTVKMQRLTAPKSIILEKEVNVGEDATIFFDIEGGWAEYKLTITRQGYSSEVKISNLEIYTATAEEEATAISAPASVTTDKSAAIYTLSGVKTDANHKGVQIVGGKKIYNK